jgi:signal peptidase I
VASVPAPGPGPSPSEPAEAAAPAAPAPRRHSWRGTVEWVVILGVALVGAFLIRTFAVQAFYIPSGSMIPTLEVHDRVLVNKLSYSLHPVHRGDVVVFTRSAAVEPSIKDLIKRVIGLPGETVAAHDGHVFVNGLQLNESYLAPGTLTTDFSARTVPAHAYWVMGDNRNNSTDSRVFGPILSKQIVGRAFVLIWPLDRLHLL